MTRWSLTDYAIALFLALAVIVVGIIVCFAWYVDTTPPALDVLIATPGVTEIETSIAVLETALPQLRATATALAGNR